MKGTLFMAALVIILFAAIALVPIRARAGDVSVDVSASWGSHHDHGHDRYRQAPRVYYQWRSDNFYHQRFGSSPYRSFGYTPYHGRSVYSPHYRPYSYYRYYSPPTYYYYGYGHYGYYRPYYRRPSSGVRVWIHIDP